MKGKSELFLILQHLYDGLERAWFENEKKEAAKTAESAGFSAREKRQSTSNKIGKFSAETSPRKKNVSMATGSRG